MNKSYKYERLIIEIFVEIIESRGLSHNPLAVQAWPWKKAAGRTWQDMRNNPESPAKLTMKDAHGMAAALGLSMSCICGMAEGRIIEEDMRQKKSLPEKKEGQAREEIHTQPVQPVEPDTTYKH